jgi:hypothetical protein
MRFACPFILLDRMAGIPFRESVFILRQCERGNGACQITTSGIGAAIMPRFAWFDGLLATQSSLGTRAAIQLCGERPIRLR